MKRRLMFATLAGLVCVCGHTFAGEWRGTVPGGRSSWTSGPSVPAGATVTISAGGQVCCQKPRIKGITGGNKCRTADTEHGEGALLVLLPRSDNPVKYNDAMSLNVGAAGRLKFKVQDTKYTDNSGSYSVTVEWEDPPEG